LTGRDIPTRPMITQAGAVTRRRVRAWTAGYLASIVAAFIQLLIVEIERYSAATVMANPPW